MLRRALKPSLAPTNSILRACLVTRSVPLISASKSLIPAFHAQAQFNTRNVVGDKLYEQSAQDKKWASSPALDSAIQKSLPILCDRGHFNYAEVWVVTDPNTLRCAGNWYADKDLVNKFTNFRSIKENTTFGPKDSNAVIEAFKTQKPVWRSELSPMDPLYGLLVTEADMHSSLSVPIIHEGKVLAVQNFFSRQKKVADEKLAQELVELSRGLISASLSKTIQINPVSINPHDLMSLVYNSIVNEGVFNATTVYQEVDWYFNHLELQPYYFERFPAAVIAKHIHSFIAAKKLAQTTGKHEDIWLALEHSANSAFYICPEDPESITTVERKMEKLIEKVPASQAFTMTYFRSKGTAIPNGEKHLGMYIFDTHEYPNPNVDENESDIWKVSTGVFLRDKTPAVRERYQEILLKSKGKLSPVLEIFPTYRDGTVPVLFGFKRGAGKTPSFLWSITELIKHNNLLCERKFIETFANGLIVYSFYFRQVERSRLTHFLDQVSLLYLVPPLTALTPLFLSGHLSGEQYAYSSAVSRCIYYFLNKRSEEFESLANALSNDPVRLSTLNLLQNRLRGQAVSLPRIYECIIKHTQLLKDLFSEFENICQLPSGQPISGIPDLERRIVKEVENELDEQILLAFHVFNCHLLKTNFYRQRKSSLSFRLDPKFLTQVGYPENPYGIIFVGGPDFHGFHIRFRDVARGGIRIIRSADPSTEVYNRNLESLFSENYNLASTQNKKNKDLPEFGSKGTILLARGDPNPFLAFQKYCSGLLDLLIPDPAINDHYGKEEILFLGPDEGTADYMAWAAIYAGKRKYPFWKAFTTGKPPSLGGVPHDTYGMTTRSVHRFVVGCLEKKGLIEENVTKCQTGGPDGDLGSNEILLSKDKTIAIIDGSGVLYDPEGINRTELVRLAHDRKTISSFDRKFLGKGGFRVLVSDKDIRLPNGEYVESGLQFRNSFHLNPLSTADLFVPCGGRPEAVNLTNVKKLFHEDGVTPRFKIIVEGANLFFTNDARMVLEKAGVILYKDASTNKGGVLSSSLEVLAALSMNDEEFKHHMQVTDPKNIPPFYQAYVKEIQERVAENAGLEFECIWKEYEASKVPRCILTDKLSDKINSLNDSIQTSTLWQDLSLREKVLHEAIPNTLIDLIGLDTISQRVPETYTKAVFGAYLASRFVYQYGLSASDLSFYEYMHNWLLKPSPPKHANKASPPPPPPSTQAKTQKA